MDEPYFKIIITKHFQLEILPYGVYLRIGKQDWFLELNGE